MSGQAHFEYYESRPPESESTPFDGEPEWRWRLRAANGEVVASGEGYASKGGVLEGIQAVAVAVLGAANGQDIEGFVRGERAIGWEDFEVEEVES